MRPHAHVVAELIGRGGMQGHKAGFMELGLSNMEEGGDMVELNIRHREPDGLPNA
jgi:hypothetical protein